MKFNGFLHIVIMLIAIERANASCYTFYHDLCPGDDFCLCTKYEACGGPRNRTNAETPNGQCSGQCRQIIQNKCGGDNDCLFDGGPCATPPSPGPNTAIGVDFASAFPLSTFQCLRQNNVTFGIVRAYESLNRFDTNAIPMIKAMRQAAFSRVDAYLFPCTTTDNGVPGAFQQVNDTVSMLRSNNAVPDRIWFDLEWNPESSCDWVQGDTKYNCQFVTDLVAAAAKQNIPFGVYTSNAFWSQYLSGCTAAQSLPLWYPAYDDQKSFAGFTSFGGWTTPVAKQYNDHTSLCGVGSGMDISWAPNGMP